MSTPLSRRSFIVASAATVATSAARSQTREAPFSVRSRSGLRLERHGDPQRPSVALYLPKRTLPSLVIEMPEHGWYQEKPTGPQTWFYKMYDSAPAFHGHVEWSVQSNALAFSMKTPSGFT